MFLKYILTNSFLIIILFLLFSDSFQCHSQNKSLDPLLQTVESYLISYNSEESLLLLNSQLKEHEYNSEAAILLKALKIEALVQARLLDEALTLSNSIIGSEHLKGDYEIRVLLQRALIYEILDEFDLCERELDIVAFMYNNNKVKQNQYYGNYLYRKSSFYRVQGHKTRAKQYAFKAKSFGEGFNYQDVSAVAYMLLSFLSNDKTEKISLISKSLNRWKEVNDNHGISSGYNNLASIYKKNHEYEKALKYCDSALSYSKIYKRHDIRAWIYELKSNCYEKLKKPDSALYYYKKYHNVNSEYQNLQQKIKISEIEFNYEIYKEKIRKNQVFRDNEKIKESNEKLIICIIALITFLGISIFLSYKFINNNKKIRQQKKLIESTNHDLSVSIKEKELLYRELHHRVKNNLALIFSLIEFQINEIDDPNYIGKFESLKGRIGSIAIVHNHFLSTDDSILKGQHSIKEYITKIADALIALSPKKVNFLFDISNVILPIQKAMPIGMLINELISNTIKHVKTNTDNIVINLKIVHSNTTLIIHYNDNGVLFLNNDRKNSLGFFIIESMITQLSGNYTREGSKYIITLNTAE